MQVHRSKRPIAGTPPALDLQQGLGIFRHDTMRHFQWLLRLLFFILHVNKGDDIMSPPLFAY